MAIFYKLHQEKREGAKNKGMWYARARMTGKTDLKTIAAFIEKNVSVKESDVYAVFIERLGTFSAGLSILLLLRLPPSGPTPT